MTRSTKNADQRANHSQRLGVSSWGLVILVAALPAAHAPGLSNFEALKELLLIGGTGVALAMWGIGALRSARVRVAPAPAAILGVIFALYTLGATLWAAQKLWGLWESLHFVALGVALLITAAPSGRALRFGDLAAALGAGALGAAIFGLLDLAGLGVFRAIWDPVGPAGTFDAVEFGAAYFVVVLPIIWGGVLGARRARRVFLTISFLVSVFYFVLLSGWIWAGIFALVNIFSAVVVGALRRPQSLQVLVPAIALSAIVGVMAGGIAIGFGQPPAPGEATQLPRLTLANPPDAEHLTRGDSARDELLFAADRMESVRALQAHAYLLSVGASLIAQKPLLGSGAGAWWPAQTEFPHQDHAFGAAEFEFYPAFRSPHNGATGLLVEYGVVGFLLFFTWIFAILAVALGALMRRTEEDDGAKGARQGVSTHWVVEHWAMLSAAMAGLVFMLFTPLLTLAPAALSWVVTLGVLARVSAEYNEFSGYSRAWQPRAGALRVGAWLATLGGLAMLVPTALNAGATYYRGHAEYWMRNAEYARAIDAYKTVEQWYPAAGEVPLNIGLAAARIGRLEEVPDWVDLAVQRRPYDVRALTLKGQLSLSQSDPVAALRFGNRAVAAYPNSLAARNLLIAALQTQQRYAEAVAQAEAMIAREPPAHARVELEQLIGLLQSDFLKNPAQAKIHYQQAAKFTESDAMRQKLEQMIVLMEASAREQRLGLETGLTEDAP